LPEWRVERGIGETRAVLVEGREIVEARIELDGLARAGSRLPAKLKSHGPPTIAVAEGQEFLLPKGAGRTGEGATLAIEVTREAIPGAEPWKRPLARVTDQASGNGPELDAQFVPFPAPDDLLGRAGWNDVLEEARSGIVRFPGGELRIAATPAMTLIDIDGYLPPEELAVAGAGEAAKAIRRLDIGGSIGIDLPTAGRKTARHAAAASIDANLPQPFERTAVNGFGFVQVVRPRLRASLIELAQERTGFEARALLRRAALEPPGAKQLVAPPAIIVFLEARADWLESLSRQAGGAIGLRADPSLPMSGAYVKNA
jgi:ribonuclease G